MVFPPTEFVPVFIYFYKREGVTYCTALNVLCLEASAKLRKATISFAFYFPLCPSVRMEILGSHETDFHEMVYTCSGNLSRKFRFL